ncbi:Hypothetical predicted protein, partial [Pelobates cultripes]
LVQSCLSDSKSTEGVLKASLQCFDLNMLCKTYVLDGMVSDFQYMGKAEEEEIDR